MWNRVKNIFSAKLEKRLDALEDPKEMLDYSIIQMEKSLSEITKNALEIGTAKKRLEMQRDYNVANSKEYEDSAKKALEFGQEDLAKEALLKKSSEEQQALRLNTQIDSLTRSMESIAKSKKELQHKTELYRAKKEELKAIYDASKAQIKVKEVMTTLGYDSKNIYETFNRVENKIQNTKAKVYALEELSNIGIIDEIQLKDQNDSYMYLSEHETQRAIEEEIAKLKAEIK
ncbi:MAG: PspA/IM30 family protein [Bacillota bacterium]